MKFYTSATLGAAMGVAMLGACGPAQFVGGKAAVNNVDAALKLDKGATVSAAIGTPGAPGYVTELHVLNSQLDGYYQNCLGHPGTNVFDAVANKVVHLDEPWHLSLGQVNAAVKVAQNDGACQLMATGLTRTLYDGIAVGTGQTPVILGTDHYVFHTIIVPTAGNGEMIVQTPQPILIRDGYKADKLRMAVRVDNSTIDPAGACYIETTDPNAKAATQTSAAVPARASRCAAMVNLRGTHTGTNEAGSNGYTEDFTVDLLTGSTFRAITTNTEGSTINYSVNAQSTHLELPAPSYDIDSNGVVMAVDPLGNVTAATVGSFKFTVSTTVNAGQTTQAATEYLYAKATDAIAYNTLDSAAYSVQTDADRYDVLWRRWQQLKLIGDPQKSVTTSDKSFAITATTLWPVTTQAFTYDTNNNCFSDSHNHQVIMLRFKANGSAGTDFDANSGVQSFQAFEVDICPPYTGAVCPLTKACGGNL